jgi:EF hand
MTSVSSTTSSSISQYTSSVSSLDTNGDGVVSAEEQAAGSTRTQDPTVTTDSAAKSSTSQLSADMMAMVLAKGDQSSTDSSSSSTDASSFESMRKAKEEERFKSMDTDSDGKVSEQEFVASRPKEVSEEDATKRFESLDTSKTGSLTQEQLESDKPKGPPMGGMDMGSLSKILSQDSNSDSGDTMSMDDVFSKMSSVIEAYRSAGGTADEASSSTTGSTATTKDSVTV